MTKVSRNTSGKPETAIKRKTRAAPSGEAAALDSPAATKAPARGARRKLATRERLLDAALALMSSRGMEGVAINEITDRADVGFGSFYNHFESKEAIYIVLIDKFFEEFADALEETIKSLEDPAEIIAASIRHTIRRAAGDAVWGCFLLREGLSARALTRGLGRRLLRDIQNGVASGRFGVADTTMCFLAVGGMVLTAITAQLALLSRPDEQAISLFALGSDSTLLDQRTATMCLQILGLNHDEALAISERVVLCFPGDPAESGHSDKA